MPEIYTGIYIRSKYGIDLGRCLMAVKHLAAALCSPLFLRATGAKLSGRIICLCCRAFTVKSGSIAYPNLCALRFAIMPFDSLEYFQLPAVNKSGFAADVSFFPERVGCKLEQLRKLELCVKLKHPCSRRKNSYENISR